MRTEYFRAMKTVGNAEQAGFSLVELGIVLAVVMTIAGLSQPMLAKLYAKHQIQSQTNVLLFFLQSVKMLAIQQHSYVTVCPSTNKLNCSKDWSKPLIAFINNNRNNQVDDNDEILLVQDGTPRLAVNRNVLHFSPVFSAANTTATLKLCGKSSTLKRALVISNMGRVRLERAFNKISC